MSNKDKYTMKDVAREAGVSIATVSRFFNDPSKLDSYTAWKLEQIIKKLGYKPNKAAQMLNTSKSGYIVQIVPDITNPFYASMTKEINRYARTKGYTVILSDTNESEEEEYNAIKIASEIMAEGVIITSLYAGKTLMERLNEISNCVVANRTFVDGNFDAVYSTGSGIYKAANYLIKLGHKTIAFVGGGSGTGVEGIRKNGFLKAIREAGITPRQDLIFEMNFSEECGYKAGKYLASLKPVPTAVCCANDLIAVGLIKSLNEQSIKVPDDVSVVGMDNIPLVSMIHPRLTSVTNDGAKYGQIAAKMLFERILGEYKGPPRKAIIDEEIIERDSTIRLI